MIGLLIFIHTVICILLTLAILMQSGKGGGLTESFSSAEGMLGAQTNKFMVNVTTILCVIFFATALTLAFMSTSRDKSLMDNVDYQAPMTDEVSLETGVMEKEASALNSDVGEVIEEVTVETKEVIEKITIETKETVEQVVEDTNTAVQDLTQ